MWLVAVISITGTIIVIRNALHNKMKQPKTKYPALEYFANLID